MTQANLALLRARHAMDRVAEVRARQEGSDDKVRRKALRYPAYVKALPAAIVQIGFGQAMATLLAKAEGDADDANHQLYKHVEHWLCRQAEHSPYYAADETPDLMSAIIRGEEDAYVRAQAETMAYLSWLKKFAVAQLRTEEVPE